MPFLHFLLRAKRARKAQNRTGTAPSNDGSANFSGREIDFRWRRWLAAPLLRCPCTHGGKCPCGLKYVVLRLKYVVVRLKLTAIKRRNLPLWPKRGVVFFPNQR